MDIDSRHVENWGRYQKRLSILLILSSVPAGWSMLFMVFTTATPPHSCRSSIADGDKTGMPYETTDSINNATSSSPPVTEFSSTGQCTMIVIANTTTGNMSEINCVYGWNYHLYNGKTTAVTEWDLVCENAWIRPLTTTLWVLGGIVSSLTVGWISDRYGRKKIFLVGLFFQFIFCFTCALSVNVAMYGVSLFMIGFSTSIQFSTGVVIVSEMLAPRERTIVGNLLMTGFAIGYMILPLFAYIAPTWRWIMVFCGAPVLLFIPYCCLIPESFRWLVQNGQNEKATTLATKIRNYNGIVGNDSISRYKSDEEIENFHLEKESGQAEKISEEREVQVISYLDIVRDSVIRRRTFICLYSWFILNSGYYFFTLNTSNLGGNEYVNCFISAFLEIPASISSLILMNFVGRRKSYIILILLSALAIGITPFANLWNGVMGIVIGMAGKLLQTTAFDLMILYTPELFPTLMRSKVLSASMMFGRVGSITAPYIVFLGENVSTILPYLIVAVLTGISGLLVLFLPETRGLEVPDTMEEAKKIRNGIILPRTRRE